MKKLFYLAVILCFVQVGISKAQTANVSDKQKQEQVTKQTTTTVQSPSVTTMNESVTPMTKTSNGKTCTGTKNSTSTSCQKKSGSCCGGTTSTSTTKKCDSKMEKDAHLNQNTGTTPK